jgi:hypothetical protein
MEKVQTIRVVIKITAREDADLDVMVNEMDYTLTHDAILETEIIETI